MGYGLDGWGSIPGRPRDFSLLHSIQTSPGAHPAFYPMGTMDTLPGVKRPGRQAAHSPPPSTEVKNGGAIPQLPQTRLVTRISAYTLSLTLSSSDIHLTP
jgi:hypothetical protein